MINRLIQFSTLFMFLFLFISCGGDNQAQQTDKASEMTAEQSSEKAEGLNAKYIFSTKDTKGADRNTNEWIGKQPTVINFWGTWCPPCRIEIPDLIKLYDEYNSQGIEIVGLAIPNREEPIAIDKFARQQGIKWPVLIATRGIAIKYDIQSVPTTIFLDKNGNEMERLVGLHDYQSLKMAFEKIL